jgi:hypothetical protein
LGGSNEQDHRQAGFGLFIKRQYHPYDTHHEFGRGFAAYQAGNFRNPHEANCVSAQAWDHGVEAAMHCAKATAA